MHSTKKTYIDPKNLPDIDRTMLRRVVSSLTRYRVATALAAATVVLVSLLNLLPAIFLKHIVDHLTSALDHTSEGRPRLLFLLCAGLVAGPIAASLLTMGQKYLTTIISERLMCDLRQQLFERLHRQSLRYFIHAKPGEIVSCALNDVQGTGSVPGTLIGIVESVVSFIATATFIVYLDGRLALIGFALLPIFVVPTRGVGRYRKKLRRAAQARMAELTGILVETLSVSGAYVIRLFGTEQFERDRLSKKSEEVIELALEQSLAGRRLQLAMTVVESLGPALIFAVGGSFILAGSTRALGTLVAFVTVLKRLYGPATALASVHVDLVTSYAYFERVFRVLDLEPAISDSADAARLPQIRGAITFEHVSLTFADGTPALRDVSLEIGAGQSVAIVGPSGSGKTTLAGLIPRLEDPTTGCVRLDGHDLRRLNPNWLRGHIGVVTQETFLFHASVLDNLRYGRPAATFAEVEAAARAARIHDKIASLALGYETVVGNRGHRLSGGERQRIAIARVLLKDPEILILDEATSSLDSTNEALIQAALETLRRGRTTVMITHKMSWVHQADHILMLSGGKVVERGTHQELLALGGRYATLHADQLGRRATDRLSQKRGAEKTGEHEAADRRLVGTQDVV